MDIMMASPLKRLASIALALALMTMWALPLAPSLSVGGLDGAGENHYCEVSKGPCRHGDSCPVGHHKKHEPAHHAGVGAPDQDGHGGHDPHAAGHSANNADEANGADHMTAFTCHGSAAAHAAEVAVIPASTNPPYTLSAYLAPGLGPAPHSRDALYRDIDMAPPFIPPRQI